MDTQRFIASIRILSGGAGIALRCYGFSLLCVLLFGTAFAAALFFNGIRIEFFALSMLLLVLLFYAILWRDYDHGMQVHVTPLSIALLLFWAWLAVTLFWSKAPYVSMVNFWWVGGAVFVFWLMTLATQWRFFSTGVHLLVLVIGLVLALLGIYQQLHLGSHAQSTFLTRNSHAALMCLIAIPAASYFLQAHGPVGAAAWISRLLGSALFVLFFSIALASSRGVSLGMLVGLAVLVALAWNRVPRRRLWTFLAIVMLAYVVADLSMHGEVAGRLATFVNPKEVDSGRFLIWERAWRMLMDKPWWGVGLGTYWLHWPPYRHPDDASGGFYVHNDYLQIWIETGLPGLLFLLAVYVAVLIAFVRLVRHPKVSAAEIVMSAGLFGGLLAIAVHTFFDFDLYIYPIQLVMGLVLAQLHAMYIARVQAPVIVVAPARRMSLRAYRVIGLLAMLLPLFYFAALGGSAMLTYQARELAAQKKWVEASIAFSRATQLMPMSDIALTMHADLLRQAILQLPREASGRAVLFREALVLLENAEKANPLRPQVFFVRGLLYQQNVNLAGPGGIGLAERAYAAALERDPLAFWAREAYGGLLLRRGNLPEAKAVLEGGMVYSYPGTAFTAGYYALVARLRRETGEEARAVELEKQIREIAKRVGGFPVVPSDNIGPGRHY